MTFANITRAAARPRLPNLFSLLVGWEQTRLQRRRLGRLSDHELRDIGISRLDANAEANRWFWDMSETRRPYQR